MRRPEMKQMETGMFARSLAGRDAGNLYVVLRDDGGFVYLADGKNRTLDRPKKKKKMHIQPDYHVAELIRSRIEAGQEIQDADIRKVIKDKEVNVCQRQM